MPALRPNLLTACNAAHRVMVAHGQGPYDNVRAALAGLGLEEVLNEPLEAAGVVHRVEVEHHDASLLLGFVPK